MKHTCLWIALCLFVAISVGEFALLIAINERQNFEGRLKAVEQVAFILPKPKSAIPMAKNHNAPPAYRQAGGLPLP